jgi:cell filamentation protein
VKGEGYCVCAFFPVDSRTLIRLASSALRSTPETPQIHTENRKQGEMPNRYRAEGAEAEFEPGSRGRVLRNLLGIRSAREMVRRESEALLAATQQLIDDTDVDQRFVADDVCRMHRTWLGDIYQWAGDYRSVNLTKGEFMFAAAGQVPRLMREFERGPLRDCTPCRFANTEETGSGTRRCARRVDSHPSVSRRQWPVCSPFSYPDGIAGRFAGPGLFGDSWSRETTLYRRNS